MDALKHLLKEKSILATIIGVSCGIGAGLFLKYYTQQPWSERHIMYLQFPGEIFMRFVNLLVVPLVTSSIISATCNLRKLGRIGLMTLYYYLTTTVLGITLSVILIQTIRPGQAVENENDIQSNITRNSITVDTLLDLIRNLVPDNIVKASFSQYQTVLVDPLNASVPIHEWTVKHRNVSGTNILGLVFFSLLLGIAINNMDSNNEPLLNFFYSLSEATMKIMNSVILIVPIGVLFLISGRILEVDEFGSIIARLGIYVLTVFIGLTIQGFILLPFLYFLATHRSPYKVISKLGPAFATACGTSSSTATIPVTLKCVDSIGINPIISRFTVPIGATINMDGIALYETIGAMFIIQLRGLNFTLMEVIATCITCTVSCIGAAGLPSGGYMMLITVLNSVEVPIEDVSLIIAVDWFVDRIRTSVNIIADALGAGIISYYYEKTKSNLTNENDEEAVALNGGTEALKS